MSRTATEGRASARDAGRVSVLAASARPVTTLMSTNQAPEDLQRLAAEQAALRRMATLVAAGARATEVFAVVAKEVAAVMRSTVAVVGRYAEDGATVSVVGAWSDHPQPFTNGTTWPLDGDAAAAHVLATGRPARTERHTDTRHKRVANRAAAPIMVGGRVWGVMAIETRHGPLADGVEHRLADFTSLMAATFSSTQAQEDLRLLADGQAALRRVAMSVARRLPAPRVFAGVAEEVGRLLGVDETRVIRCEDDGTVTVLATWGALADAVPVGTNTRLEGETAATIVRRTGRTVRLDRYPSATGSRASYLRERGIRSVVGAPIVVEGRVWGAILVGSLQEEPLAPGTEERVGEFTELVATAIANIEARSDLAASRARIVEATDEERRRVARDLHDGAQSRLVHAVIGFERTSARGDLPAEVRVLVEEGLAHARAAIDELRELARGIHPEILSSYGLAAAVGVLADRAPCPVEIAIPDERYPTQVESAAYFVAAEALTNVAKYAHASCARVAATRTPAGLRLMVEDNGVGGAACAPGGGLAGLGDRLAALDGDLVIDSPPAGGTRIRAELPLPASP